MSAKKRSAGDFAEVSKLLLAALLLLWILWIMFGYRSNLVRRAEREHIEIVHPHARTPPPQIGLESQVTKMTTVKESTDASVSKKRTRSSKFRDICWKPQCIAIADIISDGLGKSTPCDNFFDFVCEKRAENTELPPSKVKDSAIESLLRILKSPNAKGSTKSTAVGKFTSAYMSCINEGNDSLRLHESMQRIFRQLGFHDWYSSSKEPTNGTDETIGNILSEIGLRPFFDYSVQLEPRKPSSKWTIIITKRTDFFLLSCASEKFTSLSSREKFSESKQSQESAENISTKQYSRCKKTVAEILRLTSANVTKNQSMIIAEDILTFERAFSKLSKQAVGKPIEINMTSENGTAASTNFSLRFMLEKELRDINATLKDDIRVILECPDYYAGLINFVSRVNSTIAIKNYIAWSYIRSMANVEGTSLHDLYMTYSFNTTNLTRSSARKNVRKSCLLRLLKPETMLTAGTSLYIKYNFNKYHRKNLARMETVVGYPDWMMDDTVVDNLYRYIPLLKETTSFTEHIFWIQENSRY
ncbi:neprilysin-2 isoform X2 [Rhipicephalus microplus]|uniref:neprilysin-2 isoform X2 n=1 Tax=Rhipicephalus microplus TaxID=6941 RepID=UPI003F6B9DD0